MESILTVITAAETYDLTTVARVKRELGITDNDSDAFLADLVHEESSSFADLCQRVLASETVSELFRYNGSPEGRLVLSRRPVTAIASVSEAGSEIDTSLYEFNANSGILYRVNTSWTATGTEVVYTGGYVLLTTLPRKIEAAVITMVKNRWFSRSRDPSVRVRDIPDVGRWEYWVGSVNRGGGLPPDVQDAVELYRDVAT